MIGLSVSFFVFHGDFLLQFCFPAAGLPSAEPQISAMEDVTSRIFQGRVAKHANKKDEVRNHKGVSKPRLFA